MSLRAAVRPVARVARLQTRATAARRTASTSSGTGNMAPPKSSDMPWIIGSAVGFGSLAAFLLYPSKASSHAAVHDTKHAAVRAEINESAPTVKVGSEPLQARDSLSRDVKSEDPKETHKHSDRPPSSLPAKKDQLKTMPDSNLENEELKPENKTQGKNANEVAKQQHAASGEDSDGPSPSSSGSGSGSGSGAESESQSTEEQPKEEAAGKEAGEPTQQEIKDSIIQAERANTPKATMAEEVDESK
ncbi:hypothetical protein IAU60_005594 [Kwoniella sp. DSM 27419]